MVIEKINEKVLIGIGVLILVFFYIANFGIPLTTKTIVEECISLESLETLEDFNNQLKEIGNFTVSEITDCEEQNIGVFFDIQQDMIIAKDTLEESGENDTIITINLYKWCANDFFVVTRDVGDIDRYFTNLFVCEETDRCETSNDCSEDKSCQNTLCASLDCVSNETVQQIPIKHSCTVVECTVDSDCLLTKDLDCDGEDDEFGGVCFDNSCRYDIIADNPDPTKIECSALTVFYNQFQLWIIAGIALIIVGVFVFFMKRN